MRLNRNLIVSLVCFAIAAIAASFLSCGGRVILNSHGFVASNPMWIVGRIHKQWPDLKQITPIHLGNIIVRNDNYYIPTPDEAWEMIHAGLRIATAPDGDKYNCVNYAVDVMFRVQRAYLGPGVFAIGLLGRPGHMLNMIITTDGILLYDVQNDVMQKPGPEIKPYFIWI